MQHNDSLNHIHTSNGQCVGFIWTLGVICLHGVNETNCLMVLESFRLIFSLLFFSSSQFFSVFCYFLCESVNITSQGGTQAVKINSVWSCSSLTPNKFPSGELLPSSNVLHHVACLKEEVTPSSSCK